jgi:fumarate hydratase, class II
MRCRMATREAHELKQIPIGIDAVGKRIETDSMGEIEVPASHPKKMVFPNG